MSPPTTSTFLSASIPEKKIRIPYNLNTPRIWKFKYFLYTSPQTHRNKLATDSVKNLKKQESYIWDLTFSHCAFKASEMLCCFVACTATDVSKVWLYAFIDILYSFKIKTTHPNFPQTLDNVCYRSAQKFSQPSPGLLFCCPRFQGLLYKENWYYFQVLQSFFSQRSFYCL